MTLAELGRVLVASLGAGTIAGLILWSVRTGVAVGAAFVVAFILLGALG